MFKASASTPTSACRTPRTPYSSPARKESKIEDISFFSPDIKSDYFSLDMKSDYFSPVTPRRVLKKNGNFKTVQELVKAFNDEPCGNKMQSYLKSKMMDVVKNFREFEGKRGLLTACHIEEFSNLASADDSEIYEKVINILMEEAQKKDLIANPYVLKYLTQVIWKNNSERLTIEQLEQIFSDVIIPKMTLKNLDLFCELLDAMVLAHVYHFSKQILTDFQKKLTTVLMRQAKTDEKRQEIEFTIQYLYEASRRIGHNESKEKMVKRKLFSFCLGVGGLIEAATIVTKGVLAGGIALPFTLPGAVKKIIESANHLNKTFQTKQSKEAWYDQLSQIKSAIVYHSFQKEFFTDVDMMKLRSEFGCHIVNPKLHYNFKHGLIETLKQIASTHPDNKVKLFCVEILNSYLDVPGLKSKVLTTFIDLSSNNLMLKTHINEIICGLKEVDFDYEALTKKWLAKNKAPAKDLFDLILTEDRQFIPHPSKSDEIVLSEPEITEFEDELEITESEAEPEIQEVIREQPKKRPSFWSWFYRLFNGCSSSKVHLAENKFLSSVEKKKVGIPSVKKERTVHPAAPARNGYKSAYHSAA